jgi:hypothetical protein
MTDGKTFGEATSALTRLADGLRQDGNTTGADFLIDTAARVELLSEELQNCWGGPFNGQTGRQRLVLEILDKVRPDVVIETGTFRGITTEWFANHFAGPIFSCEVDRMYLIQAQHRLGRFGQVNLFHADSREFLRARIAALPARSRVLFYLDAHWRDDLPLIEELRIITGGDLRWVAMIDDFKVPFDEGYYYDDYGPGKSLKLDLLSFLKDSSTFFFPRLHSSEETGAARGACVVAGDLVEDLLGCSLLRGGDWKDWKMAELQTVLQEKIDEWSVKVDRLLELGDKQTKVGKLLAEEREKTLDLQRQRQQELERDFEQRRQELEQRRQELEQRRQELERDFERRKQELRDLLAQAEQMVGSLGRSRTLRRLSFLTTRPQRALGQTQYLLEQTKLVLDRG